ncbi:MAG: hypothetical protein ACREEW_12950 [Caulobacteraceae bacterium]
MSEPGRADELEGWAVRSRRAIGMIAGFFLFLGVSIAGLYFFYLSQGSPHISTRPAAVLPAPRLNTHLDSDPHWSFAPPNPFEHPPDPQVRRAMADLVARGDAGYAALEPGASAGAACAGLAVPAGVRCPPALAAAVAKGPPTSKSGGP